jgi:hypothetical protein
MFFKSIRLIIKGCNASSNIFRALLQDSERLTDDSVWKPLRGPVSDWPLAVCDVQTVDTERDCMATDVVTRTGFTENYQIYHDEGHLWYYLNQQLADEVVIFRQTDTDEKSATGE